MSAEAPQPPPAMAQTPGQGDALNDLQIAELTQQVLREQAETRPLVSQVESLSVLLPDYAGNAPFPSKLRYLLAQGYTRLRRIRGDGDCFYRTLAFLCLERFLQDKDQATGKSAFRDHLDSLKPLLASANYDAALTDDFYEPLRTLLDPTTLLTAEHLFDTFNDAEQSNYIVVFLRLVCAAYLRAHEDEYMPFLFGYEDDARIMDDLGMPSMVLWCGLYVEAVNKDADHLQIAALTKALNLSCKVAHLDRSAGETTGTGEDEQVAVNWHEENGDFSLGEGVALLLRPGHFDAMYGGSL